MLLVITLAISLWLMNMILTGRVSLYFPLKKKKKHFLLLCKLYYYVLYNLTK